MAQPVTLEFLDERGTVIKSVSSTDRGGPAGMPGAHRFVWDLRYGDAHGLDGGTFLAGGTLRGPIAVPGGYHVRLTSGCQTVTQPLRIIADPRSQATAADLQKQFDLLIAIRDKVSAAHDAVNEIRQIRARLAGRSEHAAAVQVDTALKGVLEELAEPRFAGFDDQMLMFDLKLNNRMAALQGYVAQGDYAPTDQQYAVFKELSAAIDGALARFTALKTQVPSM